MNEYTPTNQPTAKIEGKKTPEYPREFFELQIDFARKVAQTLGVPLTQVLREYTSLYRRFNLDRKPNAEDPLWQEFVATLDDKNVLERTYDFYLSRKDIKLEKGPYRKDFGCFTCEYKPEEKCIRVHFGNREENSSPFDDTNLEKRREELKAMFEYVKRNYPEATVVRGNSWLYNLAKYRRFFPPEYTQNPRPTTRRFTGLSGWGQLLDKDLKIKPKEVSIFKEKLAQAQSLDEILDSLPLRTLQVETKIEDFYNFYGIH